MGTVENNEFCHHLWVMNGKQPRDGSSPVMANKAASVVSFRQKQIHMRLLVFVKENRNLLMKIAQRVLLMLFIKEPQRNQYHSHVFMAGFLPQRTFTPIKWMYFMTYSQVQTKVRAYAFRILIIKWLCANNPCTHAGTFYSLWWGSHQKASNQY